jgi:hypothetical protein
MNGVGVSVMIKIYMLVVTKHPVICFHLCNGTFWQKKDTKENAYNDRAETNSHSYPIPIESVSQVSFSLYPRIGHRQLLC